VSTQEQQQRTEVDRAERNGGGAGSDGDRRGLAPLFARGDAEGLNRRWASIQAAFVDHPKESVEQADDLVGDLMQRLSRTFADERASLEEQWSDRDQVSTEELRVALRRYRSFFERLLSI
jgi:hypothetical protein